MVHLDHVENHHFRAYTGYITLTCLKNMPINFIEKSMDTSLEGTVTDEHFKLPEPRDLANYDVCKNDIRALNLNNSSELGINKEKIDSHCQTKKDHQCTHNQTDLVSSPTQLFNDTHSQTIYKEPSWGGKTQFLYNLDVLKNGSVDDSIELNGKSCYIFGRLPSCDIFMEHPSLSRHHAVVQYRCTPDDEHECGWYLMDLDSTHGTWVNKAKITPCVYHRLRVGHVMKFGGSSRLYILQVRHVVFVFFKHYDLCILSSLKYKTKSYFYIA